MPVAGATEYEIAIASDEALTKTMAGTPAKVYIPFFSARGLKSPTTYYWSVRVTSPEISEPASGNFVVTLAGVIQDGDGIRVLSPVGMPLNVNPNSVSFSWAPYEGSYEYTFILATDVSLRQTVAGTPVRVPGTSCQVVYLDYSKTYFWAIQATKPQVSIQTIGTFTTGAPPTPLPP